MASFPFLHLAVLALTYSVLFPLAQRASLYMSNPCLHALATLANNDDYFQTVQQFSPFTKRFPSDFSRTGRADSSVLTEFDRIFDLSSVCYLNARAVSSVLGEAAPDARPGEKTGATVLAITELAEELAGGQFWRESVAYYFGLPQVNATQNRTEAEARGEPVFYYHTHYFVVQQLPRKVDLFGRPSFIMYAGFSNHYRLIDWLRGAETGFSGARVFSYSDMMDTFLPHLTNFITDVSSLRWSARANRAHRVLFGIDKFGDMERIARVPFGTVLKMDKEGVRLKAPEGPLPYHIKIRRFAVDESGCADRAFRYIRKFYATPAKPASRLVWNCTHTRFHHAKCDPDQYCKI